MGKLFKLKKWLSVLDAARHLSISFGEEVSEADILRLALDGHLKLSLHLVNGTFARPCVPVDPAEIEWDHVASLDGKYEIDIPRHGRVFTDELGTFQVQESITELDADVWDLPLTGGERLDVEHRYQVLTDGPEVSGVSLDGIFVQATSGRLFELQVPYAEEKSGEKPRQWRKHKEASRFHPAGALPLDSTFVVRTETLAAFERTADDSARSTERPLATGERNVLLCIIAALCREAKLDYTKAAKAAEMIVSTADQMGISIGLTTVKDHLKKVPDALETRAR